MNLNELPKEKLIELLLIEQSVSHKFAEALRAINGSKSRLYIDATIKHAANMERIARDGTATRFFTEAKTRLENNTICTLDYLINGDD